MELFRSQPRIHVMGPSGCGKSLLLKQLHDDKSRDVATLDLDFLGFRREGEGRKKWHIPAQSFDWASTLGSLQRRQIVTAGSDSDPMSMARAALKAGFVIYVVVPDKARLQKWRSIRGDSVDKVGEAPISVSSWSAHADEIKKVAGDLCHVVDDITEVDKIVGGRIRA